MRSMARAVSVLAADLRRASASAGFTPTGSGERSMSHRTFCRMVASNGFHRAAVTSAGRTIDSAGRTQGESPRKCGSAGKSDVEVASVSVFRLMPTIHAKGNRKIAAIVSSIRCSHPLRTK